MNYYQAREMKDADGEPTGKWHYTVRNDDRIYPTGYCALDCPGHDTKEGAYEHQRQYELDHAIYTDKLDRMQMQCKVCGAYTQYMARTPNESTFVLCEQHCNREGLDKVLTVGDAISSS